MGDEAAPATGGVATEKVIHTYPLVRVGYCVYILYFKLWFELVFKQFLK